MPPPTRRRAQISSEAAESPLPARGSRRLAEKLASSSPRSSSSFAPPVSVSESSPLRRSPRKKRATEGTPRRPGAGGRTSLRGDLLSEDDASSSFSEDSSEEETSSDSADDLSSDSESDGTRAQKRRRGGGANATSASRRSKQTSSSSSSSSSQKRGKQAQPASLQDEDDGWLECEREPEELVCEAPILGGEKTRKFFRKIVITERHKTDKVVDGRKTEIKVLQYVEVAVADRDREAGRDGRDEQAEFRNRTAQVMAIFQDSPVREKKKNGRGRGRQDAEKLMVELRWLYDREDIENHCWWMNVTVSDADLPQESWELADSDKCEILPADLIDEAVVAHYDRDSFSAFFEAEEEKEKKAEERKREKKEDPKSDRREKRERRGGEEKQEAVSAETEEEEAVESVILVTHFFCTKTSAILPLSTMDPDSFFQVHTKSR
ncbi:ATPase, AAA family protein, partial [Toxoplasma gondii CAST]